MKKNKSLLSNISSEWKSIPRSVRFWNILLILSLVGLGFYDLEFLTIALFFGSIMTIALVIDGETEKHPWIILIPITLFCLAIMGIGALFFKIYKITIEPFNNWLNNKNDKK